MSALKWAEKKGHAEVVKVVVVVLLMMPPLIFTPPSRYSKPL